MHRNHFSTNSIIVLLLLRKRVNSHHAVIVLSANAHVCSPNGNVSYFGEVTEGGPCVGRVCVWLA